MKIRYFLLALCVWMPLLAIAQEPEVDSLIRPSAKIFNVVISQGLVTNALKVDSMPLRSSGSGTFFIGGGFLINLYKNTLGLRLTPGFSWVRYTYENTEGKTFPSSFDSLKVERHRLSMLEVPLGVYYNFKKDESGNPVIFGEIGGYAGYRIGSAYKTKGNNEQDQQVTTSVKDVKDIQSYRIGLYGRFGYKWAAVTASYRLTDVWLKTPTSRPEFVYPKVPALEIGLTVFL